MSEPKLLGPAPGPTLLPTPIRPPYVPILSRTERKAYQIAHRLMMGDVWRVGNDKGTPGGRRTAEVDAIAKLILEELEGWR